ncbi:MAG: RNA polymerase sigma factor [Planctomycetota bacterium]
MSNPRTEAGKIFESHQRDVYAWAFRVLGSHHDALDMVQDVFLRWLLQARKSLPEHPRAWLRRTTVNRAIDAVRFRKRGFETALLSDVPAPDPEKGAAEVREISEHVASALGRLTEMQRSVLIAKEYDGRTFAKIAQEMKIAVPTAKTHYLRALRSMRDQLTTFWNPKRSKQDEQG